MLQKTKKIIAYSLSAALLILSLAGCNNKENTSNNNSTTSSTGTISLTLWGSAEDQKMLSEMTESFKKTDNKNTYDIKLKVMGEDKSSDEVLKDISAAGDVFAAAHDKLGELVESTAIYPISTKYSDEVKKNFTEGAVNAVTYNGKMYGFPVSQKTYFLYYDKRIYSESDVKNLDSMLKKQVNPGVSRLGYDFENGYFSAAFFLTNGCELFGSKGTEKNKVTFNNASGLEVAKYISNLKSKGAIQISDSEVESRFTEGKIGAYVTGDWKYKALKEILKDNLGIVELPNVNFGSGEKHMKSFGSYNIYCVNAKTKQAEAAMSLANFLTSKENQLKRFKDRALIPTNKEISEDSSVKEDLLTKVILEQSKYSVLVPTIPQMSKFWNAIKPTVRDVFNGNIKQEDFQKSLDKMVEEIKG